MRQAVNWIVQQWYRIWRVRIRLSRVILIVALLVVPMLTVLGFGLAFDDARRNDINNSVQKRVFGLISPVTGRHVENWFPVNNQGFLHIQAPKIYTRERMVNDRFRQATWLENELRKTEAKEFDEQLSRPTTLSQSRGVLRGTITSGDPGAPTAGGAQEQTGRAEQALQDLSLDPVTLFRQKQALRDQMRATMMEAQLDDAHDLKGNTIYRLSFDATAVPFPRQKDYPGSAVFLISIKASKEKTDNSEETPADQSKRDIDEDFFREWERELQNYFSRVLAARGNDWGMGGTISENMHDTQGAALFRDYMCRQIMDALFGGPLPLEDPCNNDTIRAIAQKMQEHLSLREPVQEAAAGCFRPLIPILGLDLYPADFTRMNEALQLEEGTVPCDSRGQGGVSPDRILITLLSLIEEAQKTWPNLTVAQLEALIPDRTCVGIWNRLESRAMMVLALSRLKPMPNPTISGTPATEDMTIVEEGIGALVKRLTPSGDDPDQAFFKALGKFDRPMFPNKCNVSKDVRDEYLMFNLMTGATVAGLQGAAKKYYANFLVERLQDGTTPLSYSAELLNITLSGCDFGKCELQLELKAGAREKLFDRLEDYYRLPDETRISVYALEPRAIAETVNRGRETEMALLAGLLQATPGNMQGHWSTFDSEMSRLSEPYILGFSHVPNESKSSPVSQETKSSHLSQESKSSPVSKESNSNNEARFGWVIRPRQSPDGTWLAEQATLSALVSLPSWWGQANVTVQYCWMSPHDVLRLEPNVLLKAPEKICGGEESPQASFDLALPRSVDEALAPFQIDILKAPYFDPTWLNSEGRALALQAGYRGQLVLVGERLWRSTVVTLGGQTADRIQVMPDMRGVIAEFECVARPAPSKAAFQKEGPPPAGADGPQAMAPQSRDLPAVVWTSEGRTRPLSVTIAPFSAEKGVIPCYDEDVQRAAQPAAVAPPEASVTASATP